MGLYVVVFTAVLVICLWVFSDAEFRTKLILTGLYAMTWLLLLWANWAVISAQALLAIVLGATTFGLEFITRRH
jgi:hypothetical protein